MIEIIIAIVVILAIYVFAILPKPGRPLDYPQIPPNKYCLKCGKITHYCGCGEEKST